MNHNHRRICRVAALISFVFFLASTASSDEWEARHGLVSVTGVMNLTEPPPPSEIFFSGPDSRSQAAAWLDGLKAWRTDRRVRLRYNGAQYERPDLEWTQHIFLQVQVLIWDRSLYDPEKGEYTVDSFLNEIEQRVGKSMPYLFGMYIRISESMTVINSIFCRTFPADSGFAPSR